MTIVSCSHTRAKALLNAWVVLWDRYFIKRQTITWLRIDLKKLGTCHAEMPQDRKRLTGVLTVKTKENLYVTSFYGPAWPICSFQYFRERRVLFYNPTRRNERQNITKREHKIYQADNASLQFVSKR